MDYTFLRIFLLQCTGRELYKVVNELDGVLSTISRATMATPVIITPLAIAPDLVTLDTRDFEIRFDGSYMPEFGSGIGVTLGYKNSTTPIATFSVPTCTYDAARTEALGPTLAALIVSTMEG